MTGHGGIGLVCSTGFPPEFVESASRYEGDSPNALVVKAGKPIYARHRELGVPVDGVRAREGPRAMAVLPISHEGRVIGCLNVASHSLDGVPRHSRVALETIVAQIGSAIATLRAEEALRRREGLEGAGRATPGA
jgi:GAF domain-containing protein